MSANRRAVDAGGPPVVGVAAHDPASHSGFAASR